jgi:hypothetical protein
MHIRETYRWEVETPSRTALPWIVYTRVSIGGSLSPLPATKLAWSGVDKAVQGVKILASEGCGFEWPWFLSECVTVDVDVRPVSVHSVQPKRRNVSKDVLQLHILILGIRESLIIQRCRDRISLSIRHPLQHCLALRRA